MWENREILGGTAHLHPWLGEAIASPEDLTTFSACERGLGERRTWGIVTLDHVCYYAWSQDPDSNEWGFNPIATNGLSRALINKMCQIGTGVDYQGSFPLE